MYSSGKVLRMLTESDYFKEKSEFAWPETFKVFLSESKANSFNLIFEVKKFY